MEQPESLVKLKNNNDLPMVHSSKRKKCDPDENNEIKKDEEKAVEAAESSQLLDPQLTKSPADIDIAAYNAFRLRMLEFYMKFIMLVNSTICAVLHAQWASHVIKDFVTVLPFSIFCGFGGMFVYIILIYRWWHRMPMIWRKGCMLLTATIFCIAAVLELYFLNTHSFMSDGSMYELEYTNENQPITRYNKQVSEEVITTVAFLSFAEAALCFVDAFLLIR